MNGLLRVVMIVAVSASVWLVAASQVPKHVKLPPGAVVAGAVVSQRFGCTSFRLEPFDPFCPGHHIHTGIDLAAPTGTEVHSATSGRASVGFDIHGAGLYVAVVVDEHVRILYCHLSRLLVRSGDAVAPGQVVGLLGSSGLATGPHVHFEIQVNGFAVDPAAWLAS